MSDAILALRLSNAVAVVLLFVAGYRLGRSSGRTPWVMGISIVVVGALLVGLCIALGGRSHENNPKQNEFMKATTRSHEES